jgi:hypothetical protein
MLPFVIYMLELLLLHRVQPPLVQLLTLFASLHAVTPYHPLCIQLHSSIASYILHTTAHRVH